METKERRRSFRIEVGARATLWRGGDFHGGYTVADLSLGGCALTDGPMPDIGKVMDLSLQLPELERELQVPVRVVRRNGALLGLRFVSRDPTIEDCIHDLLMQSLELAPQEKGRTLVVHSRPEAISDLLGALEGHGHHVSLVCTPLEMVWMLENHTREFLTAVISPSLGLAHKLDVTGFLSRRYPHLRRIVLHVDEDGNEHLPRGQAQLLTKSSQASTLKSIRKISPEPNMKKKRALGGPASS